MFLNDILRCGVEEESEGEIDYDDVFNPAKRHQKIRKKIIRGDKINQGADGDYFCREWDARVCEQAEIEFEKVRNMNDELEK